MVQRLYYVCLSVCISHNQNRELHTREANPCFFDLFISFYWLVGCGGVKVGRGLKVGRVSFLLDPADCYKGEIWLDECTEVLYIPKGVWVRVS